MDISARAVKFDDSSMWVHLSDGRTIGVPYAWFPRLLNATPKQRQAVEIGRFGLHWEAIDEDISIAGLLAGRRDQTVHSSIIEVEGPPVHYLGKAQAAAGERAGNVYISPRRRVNGPIEDYVIEDHKDHVLKTFKTQKEAIDWAKKEGHHPLVARVRHENNKTKPSHWRSA
jgi:hypothetical protein